jgi:hypothetical protein
MAVESSTQHLIIFHGNFNLVPIEDCPKITKGLILTTPIARQF